MSCRSTKGGTVAHRLARAYSGLNDNSVQTLFHALKREGVGVPKPKAADINLWRSEMRDLVEDGTLSPAQQERSNHDLFIAASENPDGPTFYSWSTIIARARQEAVIRSVKGMVVDLEEPGSQAESYELGEDGRPKNVWYASYGSNLSRDRFNSYIAGGTPLGSDTSHVGARDKTEPEDDVPIRFHGRMHFAAQSGRWGWGGVAFMDHDSAGHALGRAYRIGMEQFDDVVAQENGRKPGDIVVDTVKALDFGTERVVPGLYGTLVHIGDYKGAPVFTFTSNFTASEALDSKYSFKAKNSSTNTPSDNYVRMVGSGLAETFQMSIEEQADYLRGSLGASSIEREHLITTLSTPATVVKKTPVRSTYKPRSYGSSSSENERWDKSSWANGGNNSTRWDDEYAAYSSDANSRWADEDENWSINGRSSWEKPTVKATPPDGYRNWWESEEEPTREELDSIELNLNYDLADREHRYSDYTTPRVKYCNGCGKSGHTLRDCPEI